MSVQLEALDILGDLLSRFGGKSSSLCRYCIAHFVEYRPSSEEVFGLNTWQVVFFIAEGYALHVCFCVSSGKSYTS